MYHRKNFKANSQIKLPDGYLNGQSMGDLATLKIGGTTINDAGCGPIAVYNAMQYLGKPLPLAQVVKELETYAAPIDAHFGVSGILLMIFFLRHRVRFRIARRIKKFDQSQAAVLLYWTKRPIFSSGHFVFYRKEEDGRIGIFNRYCNRDQIYYVDSVREIAAQKPIQMGYILKK